MADSFRARRFRSRVNFAVGVKDNDIGSYSKGDQGRAPDLQDSEVNKSFEYCRSSLAFDMPDSGVGAGTTPLIVRCHNLLCFRTHYQRFSL